MSRLKKILNLNTNKTKTKYKRFELQPKYSIAYLPYMGMSTPKMEQEIPNTVI